MTVIQGNGNNVRQANRPNGDGRSMGDLFRDLARDTQYLVSQEIRLAQMEVTESAKSAGMGAGLLAGAAAFGLVGLIGVAATLVAVLSLVLPVWAAALIVTILYFIIAGGLALAGYVKLKEASPTPQATIETLKEDQEWLKQQIK